MIRLEEILPPDFELNPERRIEVVVHPTGGFTLAFPRKGSTIRLYVGQFPSKQAAHDFLHEKGSRPAAR